MFSDFSIEALNAALSDYRRTKKFSDVQLMISATLLNF